MIAFDPIFAAGVHQDSSAADICFKENVRIDNRAVDVAFRGKVDHDIRMFFFKESVDGLTVCDGLFYKTEIRIVHNRSQSAQIARVGQAVQADNPVLRIVLQHMKDKVASDKAGSAGNNNIHKSLPFLKIYIPKKISA